MKTKYALQEFKENMARAISKDVEISTKTSLEIAAFIRGKSTKKAKQILERVLLMKQAIPFKRFTDGVGHRKGAGIGQGRFPQKASEQFIKIINQVEANAQAKGLSEDLKIVHLVVNKSSNTFHQGRQRRRKFKRTHLEIAVQEMEKEQKAKTSKAVTQKKEAEKEIKKEKISDSKETQSKVRETSKEQTETKSPEDKK